MVCASQAMICASTATTCSIPSPRFFRKLAKQSSKNSCRIRASSEESDCNVEECAPDKEVGKVSVEWLAGDKTKVAGTFPPRKRGWTGYVEKDTAGQTNIYSVEPQVYVAESAISSGTAGSSSDGAENTAAIAAGLALISVAAASSILLQVGKNPPTQAQTMEYSGPSLSYYINKFKPPEIIPASGADQIETPPSTPEGTDGVASAAQIETPPSAPEVTQSVS